MRTIFNKNYNSESFVVLQNNDWLEKQRVAGKIAAGALCLLENLIKDGTHLSLIELNNLAEEFILDHNCKCTFKGYKGFPTGVCISVNQQLVHGIPNNYHLQEGDLVSFDLGATYEGAIADTAITRIYGNPKSEEHVRLLKVTEEALNKAIESVKIGDKLGCIGNTIYKYVKNTGFNVVYRYGGHGLNWNDPHTSPFVSNKANPEEGIRIQPGLTIAIEPLVCIGSPETRVSSDGWTVSTEGLCSHFEHTLFVHEDYIEIITERNKL